MRRRKTRGKKIIGIVVQNSNGTVQMQGGSFGSFFRKIGRGVVKSVRRVRKGVQAVGRVAGALDPTGTVNRAVDVADRAEALGLGRKRRKRAAPRMMTGGRVLYRV